MATRRPPAPPPAPVRLSVDQMRKGILRLQRVIGDIEAFDVSTLTKRWGPEQNALETDIQGVLQSVFGSGTVEYNRYADAMRLDNGGASMSVSSFGRYDRPIDEAQEARRYVTEGKERSIQLLRQAVRWLTEEIADAEPGGPIRATSDAPSEHSSRKVFVVHGHDEASKLSVARFLEAIDLVPVILSEQASGGRTVIEAIEHHGDVHFAVVLLTPDDVGGKLGGDMKPRPRQNVVAELGYFIGRLSRRRVCVLSTDSAMELPSDFAGVLWKPLDPHGGWKMILAKELGAAGLEVDAAKVMRA